MFPEPMKQQITLTEHPACTIALTREQVAHDFCVYQHLMAPGDGQPPVIIYIGVCRVRDVLNAPDASVNTEWLKYVRGDTPLLLTVTHSGAETDCYRQRAEDVRRHRPHCNVHGTMLTTRSVPVLRSDGVEFANQTAAADALGVAPDRISKALKHPGRRVKGYTFTRAAPVAGE